MKSLPAIIIYLVCIVHLTEPKGKHSGRQRSSGSKSGPSGLAVRVSELEAMFQTLQGQVNDIQSCCQPVFEHIGTSDQYKYKVIGSEFITVPGDETFMLFQVKACNDAHIILMQSNSTTDDIYEIVIAGWSNTQSVIRDEQQGPALATTFHQDGPLDCKLMRQFWVSWDQGVIRVGTGLIVDVNEFISYANTSLTQVQHVALATGWGAIGKWMIYDKLYNHESCGDNTVMDCSQPPEEDLQQILREENEIAVASLKLQKSAGIDNIQAEYFQARGRQ